MSKKLRQAAAEYEQFLALRRRECFDPGNLDSRPSPKQLEVLKDAYSRIVYLVAGNQSGKSSIGGRVVAWKFTDTHPYWERSAEWGTEPLLMIVAGRVSDQVEELWEKKIKPFLEPGTFKVFRQGGTLKNVTHKQNGNKIIFTSHDKASVDWAKIQSYVAHHVWLDEMPSDYKYIEELQLRVVARKGQFLATFTPKFREETIRNMVDNVPEDLGRKYKMGMFDNPIFWGREEEMRQSIAHYPISKQNCILYGDWIMDNDPVFYIDRGIHLRYLPEKYTMSWPHVMAIDPAASGKVGLIIAAQDPDEKRWYIVKAMYINGKAPSVLVSEVEKIIAPYNIIKKVYDPHETWFVKEAVEQKVKPYVGVYDKSNRKKELITALQQALLDHWLLIVPTETDLVKELVGAEWDGSRDDRIKNSQSKHLIDALQYLIDNLPPLPKNLTPLSRNERLLKRFMEEKLSMKKRSSYKYFGRGRKKNGGRSILI